MRSFPRTQSSRRASGTGHTNPSAASPVPLGRRRHRDPPVTEEPSPRAQAIDESMPYLVVGVALLALGLFSIVGHIPLYAGRLPLWILLEGTGSILMVGGVLSALTYESDGSGEAGLGTADGEFILVPRAEWLALTQQREGVDRPREGMPPSLHGTPADRRTPENGEATVTPLGPSAPPAIPAIWGEDSLVSEGATERPTRPAERADVNPRLEQEPLRGFIEAIERELGSLAAKQVEAEGPKNPPTAIPTGPKDNSSGPAPEIGLPERPEGPAPRTGTPPTAVPIDPRPDIRARDPPQGGTDGKEAPPTLDQSPGRVLGARPARPHLNVPGRITGRGELKAIICGGCGTRFPARDSITCESCGFPFCRTCQQGERVQGQGRLCPVCAMLLRDSANA
jgi:hypothetical protein